VEEPLPPSPPLRSPFPFPPNTRHVNNPTQK
jgi:hypothetical protein